MNTRLWFLRFPLGLSSLVFLVSSLALPVLAQNMPTTLHGSSFANSARVSAALAQTPVMFIENAGQFDAGARFQVNSGDGALFLADDALWVTLLEKANADTKSARDRHEPARANAPQSDAPQKGVNLKFSFVGANTQPRLEPFDRLEMHVSYFVGSDASQWRPDVPVWGGVRYKEIYPNVDLELTSENGQMVQRLVAREGANLDTVQLRVEGADAVALEGAGLRVKTAVGEFVMPLFGIRGVGSERAPQPALNGDIVSAPFAKSAIRNQQSENSNARGLRYSTFLGGRSSESSFAIILDADGNAYVTGSTSSHNFPTTPGAFQTRFGGRYYSAFVTKLNAAGTALVYSTFLGGGWSAWGFGIALDAIGNAYVTGAGDYGFPTTPGAFQTTCELAFTSCVFVTKLNTTGTALEYSTFLGASGDAGYAIALDADRNAYVTGTGHSSFPTTPGAFQTTFGGGYYDGFVTKLNSAGTALVYSTFLGGSGVDVGSGIALDASGNAYVTGYTYSSDFPTTSGAFQTTFGGDDDGFVSKLNAAGTALVYSTFLGGSGSDEGDAIALDADTNAYVSGGAQSVNFPITPGAFQTTFRGRQYDAFVTKLNPAGTGLSYSTFLGGSKVERGWDIDLNADGNAYVTGTTESADFPITPGAFQTRFDDGICGIASYAYPCTDAFVTELNVTGTTLIYSTFLNGSEYDRAYSAALDSGANAFVTGETDSSNFPTTSGAFQTTFGGDNDVFVSKMKPVLVDCTAKPVAPLLSRPPNASSVKRKPVWLNWNTATCTQTYNIVVRKDSSTGRQVQAQKKMNVARLLTKPLKSGKTYYWQVEACNSFGCAKSEWWHFTVK